MLEVRPIPRAGLIHRTRVFHLDAERSSVTFRRFCDVIVMSHPRKTEMILESLAVQQDQEKSLIRQAREGSRSAFDLLFERHRQFVYNVCYRMLGSADDAVDMTQEAFIQAYRELRRFRGDAAFRTWLYRIAINQCVNVIRRDQRRKRLAEAVPIEYESNPDDQVWEVILKLEPQHRAVLVLHYFQGLTCDEMAKALGCLSGTVRTKLHRARAAFKKQYQESEK